MTMLCPICDKQITSSFCVNCKRFVTPIHLKSEIHLNELHDQDDFDCDYHGTTTEQDNLYHGTDADLCQSATVSDTSDSAVNSKIIAILLCLFVIAPIAVAVISIITEDNSKTVNEFYGGYESYNDSYKDYYEYCYENGYDDLGEKELSREYILENKIVTNFSPLMDIKVSALEKTINKLFDTDKEITHFKFGEPQEYEYKYAEMLNYDYTVLYTCLDYIYIPIYSIDEYEIGYLTADFDIVTKKITEISFTIYNKSSISKNTVKSLVNLIADECNFSTEGFTVDYDSDDNYIYDGNFNISQYIYDDEYTLVIRTFY